MVQSGSARVSEPSGLDSTSRHRAPPKREAGRRTRSAGSPEAAKQNSGACLEGYGECGQWDMGSRHVRCGVT